MQVCPDCNTALVQSLDAPLKEELSDIYVCYDGQLAVRVMEMLRSSGIEPMLRDRVSHIIPTTVGHSAEQLIAVQQHEAERARAALLQALEDGVIDKNDGELI